MTYAFGESSISQEDTSLRYICQLYFAPKLSGNRAGLPRAARNDQARVVAGEGSEDAVVLQPVERARDRGRRTQLAADDDEVLRRDGPPPELGEHRDERLARVAARRPLRQRVARLA